MAGKDYRALKITVITVCYNEKDKIRETVENVCRQTYPHIEYLLMDGASTDGTMEILREYDDRDNVHIYSEPDSGVYNAMNRGIARATGDYVFFLNAGDLFFDRQVVAEAASCMAREGEEAIYYGSVCMIQADGLQEMVDFSRQEGTLEEKLLEGAMPCHQSVFVPGRLLAEYRFLEEYRIRADYAWMLYAAVRGVPFKRIPVTVSYYDVTGTSGRMKNYGRWLEETERIVDLYRERLLGGVTALPRESDAAEWKFLSRKNRLLFQLMSCWMALKQEGVELKDFLQEKGYHSIAIYGMGNLGNILLRELEGSSIRVDYLIDRNAKNLCTALPIYRTTDALPPVGVVIVTAPLSFYEIRKALAQKVACPVVSLEDLLYEMRDGASRLGKAETEGRA